MSLIRRIGDRVRPKSVSSAARRSTSGRPRRIVCPVAQQVEGDEGGAGGRRGGSARGGHGSDGGVARVDPALELLESSRLAVGVERDDLSVEDNAPLHARRPILKRGGDLGNCCVFSLPRRDQSLTIGARPAAAPAMSTMARMPSYFRLVDEVGIVERGVGE